MCRAQQKKKPGIYQFSYNVRSKSASSHKGKVLFGHHETQQFITLVPNHLFLALGVGFQYLPRSEDGAETQIKLKRDHPHPQYSSLHNSLTQHHLWRLDRVETRSVHNRHAASGRLVSSRSRAAGRGASGHSDTIDCIWRNLGIGTCPAAQSMNINAAA